MSSMAESGGYQNKAFLAINGPRTGLLKLSGDGPKPFRIIHQAPSGADIAFEMEIALGALNDYAATLAPLLEPALGTDGVSQFLKRPLPNSPHSIAHALEQISGRLSGHLILREGVFDTPEGLQIAIPRFDLVLNHNQGEWLYQQLKQATANLPISEVKREEREDYARLEFIPTEPALKKAFRPVVFFNKASGSIRFATNVEALEETLGNGDKLRSDPD